MGTAELKSTHATRWRSWFLFAVARWGQRNGIRLHDCNCNGGVSIRCREMGTAEHDHCAADDHCAAFLFAVARWGQRNRQGELVQDRDRVSIRCREMGTAEPRPTCPMGSQPIWQTSSSFYSLSRDGDSGTPLSEALTGPMVVSIRCREMGTAELRRGSPKSRSPGAS